MIVSGLYRSVSPDRFGADIQVANLDGEGSVEFSIRRPGNVDQILGPSGWQSSEHWFVDDNAERGDGHLWVSIPDAASKHISYSNYAVSARRLGSTAAVESRLSAGELLDSLRKASVHAHQDEAPGSVSAEPSMDSLEPALAGSSAPVGAHRWNELVRSRFLLGGLALLAFLGLAYAAYAMLGKNWANPSGSTEQVVTSDQTDTELRRRAQEASAEAEKADLEQARIEAERQAQSAKAEADQARFEQARAEAEREAQAAKTEADKARAEKARAEAEQQAQENAARAEAEKSRLEKEKLEAERQAQEARAEVERIRAEQVKAEQERQARETAAKLEAERVRLEQAKIEAERQAKEAKAEAERLRVEQDRAEQERLTKAESDRTRASKADGVEMVPDKGVVGSKTPEGDLLRDLTRSVLK
jgi:chemotaxis protein histidine kinase CheA